MFFLFPSNFDPLGLLSHQGRIETMRALGLLVDDELTRVGTFLEEAVEINLFPPARTSMNPKMFRGSLMAVLYEVLDMNVAMMGGSLLGKRILAHLLGLRFALLGIPSNPVECHLLSWNQGVITTEPVFDHPTSRVLRLSPPEVTQALAALRVAGLSHCNRFSGLDTNSTEMLPQRGFRVENWREALEEPREPRAVWRFST